MALPESASGAAVPCRAMRWITRPLLALTATAIVLAGAGCGGESRATSAESDASTQVSDAPTVVEDDSAELSQDEIESACTDTPEDTQCGLTFEELRDLNMRYADRIDFDGDPADAAVLIGVVRHRLEPFVDVPTTPTEDELSDALDGLDSPQVSASAVGASGVGFAVALEGGCVFGSILEGELTVEYGGYINDGGCLAVYGH